MLKSYIHILIFQKTKDRRLEVLLNQNSVSLFKTGPAWHQNHALFSYSFVEIQIPFPWLLAHLLGRKGRKVKGGFVVIASWFNLKISLTFQCNLIHDTRVRFKLQPTFSPHFPRLLIVYFLFVCYMKLSPNALRYNKELITPDSREWCHDSCYAMVFWLSARHTIVWESVSQQDVLIHRLKI